MVLDVRGMSSVTDYFVIASAKSSTHLSTLGKNTVEVLKTVHGEQPVRKEGMNGQSPWLLVDYENVMIHVFLVEARGFYDLERLYPAAKTVLSLVE